MVEKRQQERRQRERRQQERRQQGRLWRIAPGATLPEVVMKKNSVAELVAEIRAAAPDIPFERVKAIATGIRRDWAGGGRVKTRKLQTTR